MAISLLVGCYSTAPEPGNGGGQTGGGYPDAVVPDAHGGKDVSIPSDTGSKLDAGNSGDATSEQPTSNPIDSGTNRDASLDIGSGGGGGTNAEPDAVPDTPNPQPDAGPDVGNVPTPDAASDAEGNGDEPAAEPDALGHDAELDAGNDTVEPDAGGGTQGPDGSGAEVEPETGPPVDPCTVSNGGCDAHASCHSAGGVTCTCNAGYFGDGRQCAAGGCLVGNGGCDIYSTCVDTGPGTNQCVCNTGVCAAGTVQLLAGTIVDTAGHAVASNGQGLNMMLSASNGAGSAHSNVDTSGNFSFYVPSGNVDLLLGDNGYGFFSRNDLPNPRVPGYIWNISPTIPWTAADGPLALTLPATVPVVIHVTSGGQPAVGANVSSSDHLTSTAFTLRAATGGASAITTTADFMPGNATTDANGDATLYVYPTGGQTFTVGVSKSVQGVNLVASATGVATAAGTVNVQLPDPPQLLTGTLVDTDGHAVASNGNGLNLMLTASNASGAASSNVDTSGNYSFYVPSGTVNVLLGDNGYGFFSRNDLPNPRVPGYVWNISPTVPWTGSDGPLALTLPATVAVVVHVTSAGQPVEGANVDSGTRLTSAPFTLRAATSGASAITTTADFMPGNAITDANGDAVLYVYPTSGATFTIDASATFQGVTLSASATGVATVAGMVNIQLPDPPQLLTGSIVDTNGHPVASNGHPLNLMLTASNASGSSGSYVDTSGHFSFYVPAGAINLLLGDNGYGFFSRNDLANDRIPGFVWNISPTVPWTATDGPLDLTLPATVPVVVHVTSNSQPVQGAVVSSSDHLTSTPFTLRPAMGGAAAIVTTADFQPGYATTDINGDATLFVYPTTGQTFTVTASAVFQGVTLTGSTSGIPADGTPQTASVGLGI